MSAIQTIAIIPARGGSKGVPKKNLLPLGGFPLLTYSIVAAKASTEIDRVILSTDSEEIADLGRTYGAEVPFLRPASLAQDNSPDMDYIWHAIEWQRSQEGKTAEYIIQLRPTTPLRDPELLNVAIKTIKTNSQATSLRSVHALSEPPQKMMQIVDGFLAGFFPDDPRPEYYNLPRQMFPTAYHPNGYIDIVKTDYVTQTRVLYGPRILGFVTPFTQEIDKLDDMEYLSWQVQQQGHPLMRLLSKEHPSAPAATITGGRS